LEEGRGNAFIEFLKKGRKGDCGNAINSGSSGNFRGNYANRPSRSESRWKKIIGKPYKGKPSVRLCVQLRLVCSAGDSSAMARVRSHVVRMAG
jgi:hypothetical protein